MVPLLADKGLFCPLPDDMYLYCPMASGGFSIGIDLDSDLSRYFVLGALNSKLLFWRLRNISNLFRGGWITCTKQYVGTMPIRQLEMSGSSHHLQHDRIDTAVRHILNLSAKRSAAKTTHEQSTLERQIDATDQQIDELVYELYGLTDKEIQIVEEATK